MNYGNEEHYVYFADTHGNNHGGVFKASSFLGARPLSTTTTTLHFAGMTHDNDADDIITITHSANAYAEVVKTVCAALSRKGGDVKMTTVADDDNALFLDAGNRTPLSDFGGILTGTSIAFDS